VFGGFPGSPRYSSTSPQRIFSPVGYASEE
jgi:hypothetical protein